MLRLASYDRDGTAHYFDLSRAEDRAAYGRLWSIENRRVDETKVGRSSISTVLLVVDHRGGFVGALTGKPLIFETMVFGGAFDGLMARYCTLSAARIGHEAIVRACRHRRIWPFTRFPKLTADVGKKDEQHDPHERAREEEREGEKMHDRHDEREGEQGQKRGRDPECKAEAASQKAPSSAGQKSANSCLEDARE